MPRSVYRRALLREARKLRPTTQAAILFSLGVVTGGLLVFALASVWNRPNCASLPTRSSVSVPPGDNCEDLRKRCYVFTFATGRSGTQHLSRVLMSNPKPAPQAYITHEEEHLSARTKFIVEREYRRMAWATSESQFDTLSREYVARTKVRFYNDLLKRSGASRLVYTGHLPLAYGLGPALIEELPALSIRVLRMRRDRIATAVSLMALGPEREDPWGSTEERDARGRFTKAPSENRRWFPKPTDAMVRLQVSTQVWSKLNRFQRWLWYVDDIECRWQALRREYEGKFSWLEVELESLGVLDGGAGWERVADFVGVAVNWSQIGQRDNSIEHKMRTKLNASEAILRTWDVEYRREIGSCRISDKVQYKWRQH